MGRAKVSDISDFRREFGACFSMSPNMCVLVWDEIEDALPSGVMICHLLWALMLLKVYGMEETMAVMVWTTQKTYKKWVRMVIGEIHSLAYVGLFHHLFI